MSSEARILGSFLCRPQHRVSGNTISLVVQYSTVQYSNNSGFLFIILPNKNYEM